jgi:hypothetical protein
MNGSDADLGVATPANTASRAAQDRGAPFHFAKLDRDVRMLDDQQQSAWAAGDLIGQALEETDVSDLQSMQCRGVRDSYVQ